MISTNSSESTPEISANAGDIASQLAAARNGCALFELPGRTHITLEGGDRAKFLHNFCTNDIKALPTGSGCEAFITSVQGKILGHVLVFAEPERLALSSVPDSADKLIRHLSRYHITEDVSFHDLTAEWRSVLVVGPRAEATLEKLLDGPLPAPGLGQSLCVHDGSPLRVRRADWLGLPAFELVAPNEALRRLERELSRQAPVGGESVLEYLRISAGFPRYGVDLSDANLAQEAARTVQAISFRKGCYLGQEPIARIDAMGHVNQELRRLKLDSNEAPEAGTELFSLTDPSKTAGRITSSSAAPDSSGAVCLAMVRRGHEAAGTRLRVGAGGAAPCAVVIGTDLA